MMTDKALNYEDYTYDYEKPKNDDLGRKVKDEEKGGFCNEIIGGMVLVGLGSYFFLRALGIDLDFEWWTLLLLIPGAGMIMKAARSYQRRGYVPKHLKEQASGGAIMALIGLIFLLNLSWSLVLPLFLIIPGLILLMKGDN